MNISLMEQPRSSLRSLSTLYLFVSRKTLFAMGLIYQKKLLESQNAFKYLQDDGRIYE